MSWSAVQKKNEKRVGDGLHLVFLSQSLPNPIISPKQRSSFCYLKMLYDSPYTHLVCGPRIGFATAPRESNVTQHITTLGSGLSKNDITNQERRPVPVPARILSNDKTKIIPSPESQFMY